MSDKHKVAQQALAYRPRNDVCYIKILHGILIFQGTNKGKFDSTNAFFVVDNIEKSIIADKNNDGVLHGTDTDGESFIQMPCYGVEQKKQTIPTKGKGKVPEKNNTAKKEEMVSVRLDHQIIVKNGFACQVQLSQSAMFTGPKTPYKRVQVLDVWAKIDANTGIFYFQCNNVKSFINDESKGDEEFPEFGLPKSMDPTCGIARRLYELAKISTHVYPIRDTFEDNIVSMIPVPSSNISVSMNGKKISALNVKNQKGVTNQTGGGGDGDENNEQDSLDDKSNVQKENPRFASVEISGLTKLFNIVESETQNDAVGDDEDQDSEPQDSTEAIKKMPVNDFSGSIVIDQPTEWDSFSYALGFGFGEIGEWKKDGKSGKAYCGNRYLAGITDRNKHKGFWFVNRVPLLFFTKKSPKFYFGALNAQDGSTMISATLKSLPILANIFGYVEQKALRIPNTQKNLLKMICSDENILTYKDDPDMAKGRYSKLTFLAPEKIDSVSWILTYPDEQNKIKSELQKGNPLNFDSKNTFLNLCECIRDPSPLIDAQDTTTKIFTSCIGFTFSYVGNVPENLDSIYEIPLPNTGDKSVQNIFDANEKVFSDPKRTKESENEQYFWNIVVLLFTFWTYVAKAPLYKKDLKKRSKYLTSINSIINGLIPEFMGHVKDFQYAIPEKDDMYELWTGMSFVPYLFPNPEVVVPAKEQILYGEKRKPEEIEVSGKKQKHQTDPSIPDRLPDPKQKQIKK